MHISTLGTFLRANLLTEIWHGEVASFGSEVADAPAEAVIVISMLLTSITSYVVLFSLGNLS